MVEKSQYTESNTEFKRNGNSIYNREFVSYLIDNDFFKIIYSITLSFLPTLTKA